MVYSLEERGICICRVGLQVVFLDKTIDFDEYIFNKIISKAEILYVVYRYPNSLMANNAQLCKLIGYMENTSNIDLVTLDDFNYAAIDWNTMDVPSNLVNE